MNNACRRVAARVPSRVTAKGSATAIRPTPFTNLLQSQYVLSKCQPRASHSILRSFTTSRALRSDDEESKKSSVDKTTTTRGSAQHTVNDRPWQRAESGQQPKSTSPDPTGGSDTKGRLLTTPTRLLKLILPMPFHPDQEFIKPGEEEEHKKELGEERVEPLALLVHPQQPLSYLERLIQAEIPPIKVEGRRERLPDVHFRAEADREEARKQKDNSPENVASYSGLGREGPEQGEATWVRWSGSTEVGDFIRDAARGREFAIVIEGHPTELRVAVPSFKDRTYYMRMRLRRMSKQIEDMSSVKQECDQLAHKSAHRLAQGGFAALSTWWGIVYYVTFHTDMGWDLVEPVTYLAGLTTIMAGYLWFLFISRDLSYRAAMNLTVSKRQTALYAERGFDSTHWEHLVHEANQLRREVKAAANEYDVEWDELKDLGGESIKDLLEGEKSSKEKKKDEDDQKDDKEEKKGGDD